MTMCDFNAALMCKNISTKKMKILISITTICFIFFTACSKGDGSSGSNGNPPTTVPLPVASTLTLPLNNTACLSGVNIDSNNASITFSWQAATNAETYDLVVKNLISAQKTTYAVSATTKDIVLAKSQPYSWYIVSKSSKTTTTAQSAVWKFYVAGSPTSSYVPFPAVIIAPLANAVLTSGTSGQMNVVLQWDATDIDNDIASYAIYLDNKDATSLIIPSIQVKTTSLSLAFGKTYYWRVITNDSAGNSSDSGIFSFIIQ